MSEESQRKNLREMTFGNLVIAIVLSLTAYGATRVFLRRYLVPLSVEWGLLVMCVAIGFAFAAYKSRLKMSSSLLFASLFFPFVGFICLWLTPLFTGVSF